MQNASLAKLTRILALLGSDQAGERAVAALAAHKLVNPLGLTWADLLEPASRMVKPVHGGTLKRSPEWGMDYATAAEARMRQLKSNNERLETQLRALRTRVAALAERERRSRAELEELRDQSADS